MQLTHHLKPAGVKATAITRVHYQGGGYIYVHLTDGRTAFKSASASPGDFYVEHPDGDSEILHHADFAERYEACDPILEESPPAEIIAAARLVGRYFAKQHIADWELGPCKARFPRDHNLGKQCAPLDGILTELRAKRDKAPGPIRREYNDICDRIDVLNSLEAQLASAAGSWHDFDIYSSLLEPRVLFLVRRAPGRDPVAVNGESV